MAKLGKCGTNIIFDDLIELARKRFQERHLLNPLAETDKSSLIFTHLFRVFVATLQLICRRSLVRSRDLARTRLGAQNRRVSDAIQFLKLSDATA